MSSKRLSPTSSVLRSSRLFSLPQPLPRPDSAYSGLAAGNKVSDSATTPYPLQQAITSPPSSQARGDWGLKRPLPLRSTTRTSTPFFRIHAVDTREHITDFDSAADLTVTLDKFQELGLPITTLQKSSTSIENSSRSVFEPELDHTDPNAPRFDPQTGEQVKRWKFQGPWLAGMTEADFSEYIERELIGRKDEFLAFVRQQAMEAARNNKRRQATDSGERDAQTDAVISEPTELSLAALRTIITRLRRNFSVTSDLTGLVVRFLDLPGSTTERSHYTDSAKRLSQGPPSSHPSAGLSYLRTDAVLTNHPIFGPMANPAPQKARLLAAGSQTMVKRDERLGVAGFIADKIQGEGHNSGRRFPAWEKTLNQDDEQSRKDMHMKSIGLSIPGGTRIWVEPKRASVDETGRLHLEVRGANSTSVDGRVGVLGSTAMAPGTQIPIETSYKTRPDARGPQGRYGLEYATGESGGGGGGGRSRGKGGGAYGLGQPDPMDRILQGLSKFEKGGGGAEKARRLRPEQPRGDVD